MCVHAYAQPHKRTHIHIHTQYIHMSHSRKTGTQANQSLGLLRVQVSTMVLLHPNISAQLPFPTLHLTLTSHLYVPPPTLTGLLGKTSLSNPFWSSKRDTVGDTPLFHWRSKNTCSEILVPQKVCFRDDDILKSTPFLLVLRAYVNMRQVLVWMLQMFNSQRALACCKRDCSSDKWI